MGSFRNRSSAPGGASGALAYEIVRTRIFFRNRRTTQRHPNIGSGMPNAMIYHNAGKRKRLEHLNIKSFYFLVVFAVITMFLNGCNKSPADMYNLGVQCEAGQGVSQDYAKAREWYQKAADAGDANAMSSLGVLYEKGQGVAQDHSKAREWYQKAADAGYPSAMNNLGLLYDNGQGLAQDHSKAREWYRKAADAGNTYAMNNLGTLYDNGQGVAQDYSQGREWYEKAAAGRQRSCHVQLRYAL